MKESLVEVLREFYSDGLPEWIVSRDVQYVEKAHAATVVKGMRRTGKTFVTYARIKALMSEGVPLGRVIHINFEDNRLRDLTLNDLECIGEAHAEIWPEYAKDVCWYFLDELQNVKGWESYARRLLDSKRVRLCLTGSSSKLLSEEIATQMRERSLPIEVFPLSFREFLRFNGIMDPIPARGFSAEERGVLCNALTRYLECGGFPDVQDVPDRMRIMMLQGYVDAVVYRDVLERHEVASIRAFRYTLDYLFHNYARKISTRAISGVLKNLALPANRESVGDYISWLKDAYLVHPVPVLSDSLAVKRVNPDKYYLIDTGLVRAMSVKNDQERGWMLENLVYLALRRGLNKISYLPMAGDREVDFHVVDEVTKQRRLVQVAWEMSDKATFVREYDALVTAKAQTGIKDCTIVTWNEERTLDDGIRIMPAWKWLLSEF